jgi:hypothetical protein
MADLIGCVSRGLSNLFEKRYFAKAGRNLHAACRLPPRRPSEADLAAAPMATKITKPRPPSAWILLGSPREVSYRQG